jgi:hypothetical protein
MGTRDEYRTPICARFTDRVAPARLDLVDPGMDALTLEPVAREFGDRAFTVAFLRREGRINGWDTDELL